MDYREKTIEMLKQMKNKDFIRMIYFFVKVLHEKEKA